MRRDPGWLIVLAVVAAVVAEAPAVSTAAAGWSWLDGVPSFVLLGVTVGLLVAARSVPAGATRDFLVWLALAAWGLWAFWKWLL